MSSQFQQKYNGRFYNALRWTQLDTLWGVLKTQSSGWYVYFINHEDVPLNVLEPDDFQTFLDEINVLLREDHDYDYCGIVYADSFEEPTMVKIYDPHNLGASCGSSGRKIHPRWLLSKIPPEPIEDDVIVPNIRKRWWQRIFETS
ncbi:MAG: hypothetical protein RIT27_1916 [Pseudomonadota bacterium]|jgi:hypothetical protein